MLNFFRKLLKTAEINSNQSFDGSREIKVKPEFPETSAAAQIEISSKTLSKESSMSEEEKNALIDHFVKEDLQIDNTDLTDKDELFEEAARLVVQNQIGSTSLIQRKMKIGYNRAGRLMDQLEISGIVGRNMGDKAREVLIKTENELELYFSTGFTYHKNQMQLFFEENRDLIEQRRKELHEKMQEEQSKKEKEQIRQELLERERKRKLQKEVLKELIEEGIIFNQFMDKEGKRETIPQDIMDKVWNRDGGKCVQCGNQENLEFDHIIPFSKGGATTYRNLQILCKKCNIEKSNKIG